MSVPNIPDICPEIILEDDDVYNLTLTSIALEEIALSQIIKAESEKITVFINKSKCNNNFFNEVLKINESVESVLDKVYAIENLLVTKTKLVASMRVDSYENCKKEKCEQKDKDSMCNGAKYTVECTYDKEYSRANKNINNIFSKFK